MKIFNLCKLLAVVSLLFFIAGCPLTESKVYVISNDSGASVSVKPQDEVNVDVSEETAKLIVSRETTFSSGSNIMIMGETGKKVIRYSLFNNSDEVINIADATLCHYFLDEGDEEFGQSFSSVFLYEDEYDFLLARSISTDGQIVFSNLDYRLLPGNTIWFYVEADTTIYENGAVSGSRHQIVWKKFLDGGFLSIKAFGESSGLYLDENDVFFGEDGYIASQDFFVFRTKVIANWAADTPSGAAVGGDDYVIGKVKIYNLANAGSYEATIKGIDLEISSSFDPGVFEIKVYREHQFYASRVFRADFDLGGDLNSTISLIFDQAVSASDGGTETFIITMDTYAARANDSLAISPTVIYWSDGASEASTDSDMDYKVLEY